MQRPPYQCLNANVMMAGIASNTISIKLNDQNEKKWNNSMIVFTHWTPLWEQQQKKVQKEKKWSAKTTKASTSMHLLVGFVIFQLNQSDSIYLVVVEQNLIETWNYHFLQPFLMLLIFFLYSNVVNMSKRSIMAAGQRQGITCPWNRAMK